MLSYSSRAGCLACSRGWAASWRAISFLPKGRILRVGGHTDAADARPQAGRAESRMAVRGWHAVASGEPSRARCSPTPAYGPHAFQLWWGQEAGAGAFTGGRPAGSTRGSVSPEPTRTTVNEKESETGHPRWTEQPRTVQVKPHRRLTVRPRMRHRTHHPHIEAQLLRRPGHLASNLVRFTPRRHVVNPQDVGGVCVTREDDWGVMQPWGERVRVEAPRESFGLPLEPSCGEGFAPVADQVGRGWGVRDST